MKLEQIHLKDTGSFSSLFLDYINQRPELKKYYNLFPTEANFEEVIKSRQFSRESREILHKTIYDQYSSVNSSNKVKQNIDLLLDEKTFTITTGHQLNIFTGPLFFEYKILTVINTCEVLKKKYPQYNFVPVYWMASEDHDFDEINHFYLYGKKYEWKQEAKGAVGRLRPQGVLEALDDATFIPDHVKQGYKTQATLSDATRHLVNDLFGDSGLVILDADDKQLKGLFKSVINKELFERKSHDLVQGTTKELEDLGYKSQISPREINLFFLDNKVRERIEFTGGRFNVLNTDISFSEKELAQLVETSPEKFSPNVVLRPVYQEVILPNLAYIGGPAEVVYWLQLKESFNYFNVFFPLLMPRNFALIVDKTSIRKYKKVNIPVEKLFLDNHLLKTYFIEENSEVGYHLDEELSALEKVFEGIRTKASQIDKSLVDHVGAEFHKVKGIVKGVEKKFKRAEERNLEVSINQLLSLKSKLFPSGKLQERHDNFLSFYINDERFIYKLKELLNPLDFKFNIILEDEEG